MSKLNKTAQAQLDRIFAKAKVQVVARETVQERNELGHFKPAVTRMVLEGPGVKAPISRNYFKKVRMPLIQELVPGARFPRVKRGTGQAVLELVG